MTREYVEQRDGGYWITGTRVSLDSICTHFPGSETRKHCPILSCAETGRTHGAIAYCQGHRKEVDSYLRRNDREFETLRARARQANPDLYEKLEKAKKIEEVIQVLNG